MAETREGGRSRWCSYFAVKLMLVTYAFLCWLLGITLLLLGAYSEAERQRYRTLDGSFLSPSIILIVAGCISFPVSFLGFVGALRDNLTLLRIFICSLCVAILVESVVGLIIILGKEQTKQFFSDHVRGGIRNYYDDLDFKNLMDYVQEEFQCCGADSYTDWEYNPYHLCSAPGKAACGVPYSCCATEKNPGALLNSHCGYGILHKERLELTEVIHVRGCTHAIFLWIGDRLPLAIFVSVLILLSQGFGIATSYLLSKNITQTIEERQQNCTETDGPMLMEPAEDSSRMRRWLYMYLPHEQATVTLMSAQT
ncbi:tetraspanin-15-like [Lethenteron reissneri]|uniref:tetraspanin-15-like n=1 Tax=Lethenteron reissneri TaxID=7753 RepID=UPI002AB5F3CB|nr:tetraspanin-15-like [Lethenteron reissneri]